MYNLRFCQLTIVTVILARSRGQQCLDPEQSRNFTVALLPTSATLEVSQLWEEYEDAPEQAVFLL